MKWSNAVPGEGGKSIVPNSVIAKNVVGESGKQLNAAGNGDIVVSHQTIPEKGEAYQTFYTFGKDGKLKSTKKIKGSDINDKSGFVTILPNDQLVTRSNKLPVDDNVNKTISHYSLK